ncbi:IS110 family transposase [Ramlibacter sp. PS3R-8]|uniref:IS110 family transposase n=1 Tax=Ramlibacter sp. PS3R-8 TaxID=3133437 RepID=UPI00309530A2
MSEITRVGVDLAKHVIPVHGVDATERVVIARGMSRQKFAAWCAQLPAGCVVAMEACSGAHHWARRLMALGLQPRSHRISSRLTAWKAKVARTMRPMLLRSAKQPHDPRCAFVPVKSCAQQGVVCVHRLREAYKEERTGCINRIRGLLSEFGLVFPKGPAALRTHLSATLEDASNELPGSARLVLDRAFTHWRALDEEVAWCDAQIAMHAKEDGQARQLQPIPGIGPVSASALIASVGDLRQFRSAGQFAAWLGLVPRQNSSGGKTSLGGITKRGDDYLRTLLIQGARSVVSNAARHGDAVSRWILQLQQRIGWQRTLVAVANKNARIIWAVLVRGRPFDPHHVSARVASG